MSGIIGAAVSVTEATLGAKTFGLGDRRTDAAGREYVYVKAASAITGAGYVCVFDESYSAAMVSTSNDAIGDRIGIPATDFAAGAYGWLQVLGPCIVRTAADCAANAILNTTGTAGQVDDDGASGAMSLSGVVLTTAAGVSAGTSAGMLVYPVLSVSGLDVLDGITATAAEINNAADVSARVQELTETGAVTAGVQSIELNHATVVIAATIADLAAHPGLLVIKDTSATGTAEHTVTLTAGTFNGTNTIATFNARDEMLAIYVDSAGRGQVVANVGSVALSGP